MTGLEKKRELEAILYKEVLPLIDRDYVLYGLPYYNNVGDTLIWNGEIELLKKAPHKCRGVCAWDKYPKSSLPDDLMILVTGGGYFGDLWRRAWQEVLDGLKPNKNHRIIIMPCSIFYEDAAIREQDSVYLAQFPDLTILVRDRASLDYANRYFKNKVILVPDMAFCMNEDYLRQMSSRSPQKEALFFARKDKEKSTKTFNIPEKNYDTHDWLPMEKLLPGELHFNRCMGYAWRIGKISKNWQKKLEHYLYRKLYRKHMTDTGTAQLANYKRIYSTRLHAMILAVMLGRPVKFIDNSYGKIGSYYETWLKDCDIVSPID